MALTPVEIHNKDFRTKFKGYDVDEVNEFLDEIVHDMEELIRVNKDLEKRIKFNEDQVEYFNSIKETLNKSIVVAQEAADHLKENAKKEADIIRFEAEKEATAMLRAAAQKATEINEETEVLKADTRNFKEKMLILMQSQIDLIKNQEWTDLLAPSKIEEIIPTSIEELMLHREAKIEE